MRSDARAVAGLVLVLAACGAPPSGRWVTVDPDTGHSYALMAPPGSAHGVLLLLGAPGDALLPRLLADRGVASVVPAVQGERLFLDRPSMQQIEAALLHALQRTGAPPGAVVAGGISLGGTGAVRYTQQCALDRCARAVAPRAVFAVDAPLDMERLWRSATSVIRRGWPGSNLDENQFIVDRLAAELGGAPQDSRAAYLSRSPFSYAALDGGNARELLDIPVRLYIEPDIEYWITERRFDYYNLNAFDAAGLVNRLLLGGSPSAELIVTSRQGVRPSGVRNPHSWSIVDEPDLARWVLRWLGVE